MGRVRKREAALAGPGLRGSEVPVIDRLFHGHDPRKQIDVTPTCAEELAAPDARQERHADHGPGLDVQPCQQSPRLLEGEHGFGSDRPELRQLDSPGGVLPEVSPGHRRTQHRAQDIVDVVDRLGRVAGVGQLGHIGLDVRPAEIAELVGPEAGHKMLPDDVPVVVLRGIAIHGKHGRHPVGHDAAKRDPGPHRSC